MKAATTALSSYLNCHPNVYLPPHELHFFDRDDRYQKGNCYYQQFFRPGPEEFRVGEKTPTYSYHEESPKRIVEFNPDMRLIWIFRNPTERAYSHYWYFVQNGQERYSFEKAIALEPVRRKENIGYSYVDRGLYVVQIERFLQHFPRENMLFLLHEEYVADPESGIRRCLRFLGLPDVPDLTSETIAANATHLPRAPVVQWLAYRLLYYRFEPGYRMIRRLNKRREAGYPPLPASIKSQLDRYYAPYNAQFAAVTGLDISRWQSMSHPVRDNE